MRKFREWSPTGTGLSRLRALWDWWKFSGRRQAAPSKERSSNPGSTNLDSDTKSGGKQYAENQIKRAVGSRTGQHAAGAYCPERGGAGQSCNDYGISNRRIRRDFDRRG